MWFVALPIIALCSRHDGFGRNERSAIVRQKNCISINFKSQPNLCSNMYGMHNAISQVPFGYEWIFIIIIIVVIFFGVKKIPELARSFGKATAEYEKARIEAKKELEQIKREDKIGREKLEEIAESLGIDYTNKDDVELRKAIEGAINKEKGS